MGNVPNPVKYHVSSCQVSNNDGSAKIGSGKLGRNLQENRLVEVSGPPTNSPNKTNASGDSTHGGHRGLRRGGAQSCLEENIRGSTGGRG